MADRPHAEFQRLCLQSLNKEGCVACDTPSLFVPKSLLSDFLLLIHNHLREFNVVSDIHRAVIVKIAPDA